MQTLTHYHTKLRDKGISKIIAGRFAWYKLRFQMDNWFVGRLVEWSGNRINLNGVTLSVENPLVSTRHKGSMYFGIYKSAERELSAKFIDRSLPTVEIGGSIGGVSCTVSKLLDDPTKLVVVECNPVLLPTLEINRELNHCSFEIEPLALAYDSEIVSFTIDNHFMTGRLDTGNGRKVTVRTTSLKSILDKYNFETINLISDCEGAEIDLVTNEANILRDRVKWLILETHEMYVGAAPVAKMLSDLRQLGFEVVEQQQETVLALRNMSFNTSQYIKSFPPVAR